MTRFTPFLSFLSLMAALALLPPDPAVGQERDGLRIYISADMEGVVGAVTGAQLGPGGFEYARFREFMTDEVNAAIEGARRAGADEIVVSDSHGNGQNLLLERLPEDILVVRSWPRPLGMMEGIDETFDGAIFIGYHASTDNPEGVRAHTFSSANYASVRLDGQPVPEGGVNAAIAGHFGVPVILVTGDEAAVREVADLVGDVEEAVVKWSYGFHSARTMMPEPAFRLIRERAEAAVRRIAEFEPHRLEGPVELEVRFKSYMPAEVLSYLPDVDRPDSHTIRFVGEDMVEISRFLQFMGAYRSDLSP